MTPSLLRSPLIRRASDAFFNWIGDRLTPTWDRRLLGLTAVPFDLIIDVGANRGQFAKSMARTFPKAQILAVEPLPEAFTELNQWGSRQGSRVQCYNLALGDTPGTVTMQQHLLFSASSSLLPTTDLCETLYPMVKAQETLTVTQSTLDDLVSQWGQTLPPGVLVKLDVQGVEDRVIRGGQKTLGQARACIVEISLDTLYKGQCSGSVVFSLLDSLGLQYGGNLDQILAPDGHVRYLNAVFIRR